jgi:hypothetical protein
MLEVKEMISEMKNFCLTNTLETGKESLNLKIHKKLLKQKQKTENSGKRKKRAMEQLQIV